MRTIRIDPPLLKSIAVLAAVVEARDAYTGGHIWRVSQYTRLLADHAGLSGDEVFVAATGALVHDIGKLGVPDAILNKHGRLNNSERNAMRRHPQVGRLLVQDHPLAFLFEDAIGEHHEHYDGQGYPDRLEGAHISLFSRLVSIADAFDAMTTLRSYKRGISPRQAYDILADESGRQFDPQLVPVFVDLGLSGRLDHILGHSWEDRMLVACPECGPIISIPHGKTSGDAIVCPGCTRKFILHAKAGSFEIEWQGHYDPDWLPEPDMQAVEDFLKRIPKEIRWDGGD